MSSQGSGNQPPSTADLYREAAQELQNTLENILTSHEQVNQRAIDLAKIDLLSASVIVTGISINGIGFSFVLVGGFLAFLYAIWCCAQVYQPREFNRGFGRDGGINIDRGIQSGITPEKHYRKVLYSYIESVKIAKEQAKIEKELFQKGLWSSVAAILFFAVAGVAHAIEGFPWELNFVCLFIIPIVTRWGKDKTPE